MKLLTITHEGQGGRANDFCWADEGEIARFGMACDGERIDGRCGCRRSMVGLASAKASTTVKVNDVDITFRELVKQIATYHCTAWKMSVEEAVEGACEEAQQLAELGEHFTEGQILEIRGESVQLRQTHSA